MWRPQGVATAFHNQYFAKRRPFSPFSKRAGKKYCFAYCSSSVRILCPLLFFPTMLIGMENHINQRMTQIPFATIYTN